MMLLSRLERLRPKRALVETNVSIVCVAARLGPKGASLDIAAGVTLAAYLLPGLGDASLANLPPEFLTRDTTKPLLLRVIRLI